MKIKQTNYPCLMSVVFICHKDTLAVLNKFHGDFHVSNKIHFQNYFANKLLKLFVLHLYIA